MKLTRNIWLYYVDQALSGLIFTIPVWVVFQHRYLNFTQMAWTQSAAFIGAILLQMPTGAFADVFGRKKAIMLGWLVAGSANIYLGYASSATGLIVGLLAVAIGTTFVSGADVALLYDSLKTLGRAKEFSKINARGMIIYRSGMIVAIFTGGYLYAVNVGLPVISKGIAELIIIAAAWRMIEPALDSEKFTLTKYAERLKMGAANLLTSSHIRLLSLYYILVGGITWSCLFYLINTFANDIGFDTIGQSWLFAGIYIISTSIILFITEHKTLLINYKKLVYLVFPVLMMIALLPGAYATKTTGVVMLFIIVLMGGARFAILDGFMNEEFGSEARATTLSTLNLMVQLLTAVIIFINGPIQERYTSKPMFTLLGIATLVFVMPLALKLFREKIATI